MTYSIMGSGATSIHPTVATPAGLFAMFGGEAESADGEKVLVLRDPGNQIAYVIEGTAVEILDLLDQARDVVIQNIGSGA